MIRKKREKPIKLLKTEALERRMPEGHPAWSEIEQDRMRLKAGFKGEQSLDYHLTFIPREPYLILHDLRLSDETHHFQIDTLILHPSFFLVIEVKNFSGTLHFDPLFDQMIRMKNGLEEAFPDPVRQVVRQSAQLIAWLKNHHLDPPPVESLVVIANSQTLLKSSPGNQSYLEKVIRDTRLVESIHHFADRHHRREHFTPLELRKLATLLIRKNTPLDPDLLTQYGLAPSDLVTGVCCPSCGRFAMERRRLWHCPHCAVRSRDAHLAALRDYCLLVGPTISNHEAKDFLHLPSPYSAHNLLMSLGVAHEGATKGRKYDLSKMLK